MFSDEEQEKLMKMGFVIDCELPKINVMNDENRKYITEALDEKSCRNFASWDGGRQSFDFIVCMDQFDCTDKFDKTMQAISDWANDAGYAFTVRPFFYPVHSFESDGVLEIMDNIRGNKMHLIFINKSKPVKVKCPISLISETQK